MKKFLILLCILPLLSFNPSISEISIFGTWKGEDKGDIGFVTFEKDGYAFFEADGEKMGGREFMLEGEKAKMMYRLNTETNPIELDFEITFIETEDTRTLLGILNFITEDKMTFAIGFGGSERPTEFNDENSIIFEREH
ncbi:uncharacterized domain TIGR03067 protein [Formosa sp. Hel1_31_208]|uniref:hypothetical protein n=1 Tax=Formosa sp. Hel1_31_208 TaxID=1798225 RepID=UPI00087C751B|nr:hypothetical protein [Formosa sp. Hel1_31_208]SDS00778.1 uncharacterized domain TIGR03067 protein [Formosa sp. Hel1_31_208]